MSKYLYAASFWLICDQLPRCEVSHKKN